MAFKKLNVEIGADTKGFQKGMKTVHSGIKGLSSGVASMMKGALALTGLSVGVAGIVKTMQAYAGLRNSVQRTNELFKDSNKYIKYFAENNSRAFGMAETTAYQYAMTYGNLFKGITKDTTENAKVTIAMMKASAVIASKTGRTMEDVNERIRSGILGNTEAIEDLGINVPISMIKTTRAFKDVAKGAKWENLTYQQQQQIRVLAILEQATNQYGTTVSQISGWSLPRLGQAFKDLVAYAGMFVTAGLQPVINALGALVTWATAGLKALAKLFGMKLEGNLAVPASNAAAGLAAGAAGAEDMADGLDEAGKKAKKLNNQLAGFDVFNDISKAASSGSGSGGAGGGASPFDSIAMPGFDEAEPDTSWIDNTTSKYKELMNTFKNSSAVQDISSIFGELKTILSNVWNEVKPDFELGFSNLFSGLKSLGGTLWNDVVIGLGSDLIATLKSWFSTNAPTIQTDLSTNLKNIFSGVFSMGNVFGNLSGIISTSLAEAKPAILNSFYDLVSASYSVFDTSWFIISDAFSHIWDFIDGWVSEKKEALIQALSGSWKASASTVSLFSNIIEDAFVSLKEFWMQWGGDILNIILEPFRTLGNMVLETWNSFVLPVWNEILDWLKKIWDESLSGLVGEVLGFIGRVAEVFGMLWDVVGPYLETAWANLINSFRVAFNAVLNVVMPLIQNVIDQIKSIIKILNGVLDFMIGIFTADWKRAWEGIKTVFEGIWDGIKATFKMVFNIALGTVESFINGAISMINSFIRAINLAIKTINTIPGVNIPLMGTIQDVKLPRLAKGGIAYGEVQALVGDNFNAQQNPEVIAPLSTLKGMIVEALMQKEIATGGSNETRLILQLENGEVLADMLIDPMNKKAKNMGFAPVFKPAT